MENILGAPSPGNPKSTLINALADMAMSNFVSAKVQGQRGTNEAYQRITNNTKAKTVDTVNKQNPLQNQPSSPDMSTNIGNCQGPITKVFFVKDTP